MNCNCNCCNTIRSTGFGTTETNLVILTTTPITLTNGNCYDLIVCQRKPSMSVVLPVVIQVNGVNYPLLDRIGNPVMSDQITCRTRYRMYFGESTPHFLTTNCLRRTQNYNPAPAVAAAMAMEEVENNEVKARKVK